MVKGISIIICCYNSALRIRETLRYAFSLQVGDGVKYEVIVIDNNSSDDTAHVAAHAAIECNERFIPFKVVDEPVPGLSNARKRGMSEALYDLVLFCDDDNHLHDDYLINAVKILEGSEDVAILGGWCRPKLLGKPASWIVDFYPALAIEEKPKADGDQSWIFGAGMIIRKSIFSKLEEKNIELHLSDRVGKKQTSGGDCELCLMTKFLGYRVYYSSTLQLDHQVSEHRLAKMSFVKANFKNVYSVIYLYLLESLIADQRREVRKLFNDFRLHQVKHLFYFLPRMIAGRHRFYSFIQFYQGVQLSIWLMINRKKFSDMATGIKKNLYQQEA